VLTSFREESRIRDVHVHVRVLVVGESGIVDVHVLVLVVGESGVRAARIVLVVVVVVLKIGSGAEKVPLVFPTFFSSCLRDGSPM